MVMPKQKPGRSEQVVETDPRLIKAVVRRFGPLVVDLAASAENTQAKHWLHEEINALRRSNWATMKWTDGTYDREILGNRWLNPPFGQIARFAAKCCTDATPECPVLLHVPASVGANWWRDYVHNQAMVYFLNGRVTYVGHKQPYPKDTVIAVYGPKDEHFDRPLTGYDVWEWMKDVAE